MKKLIVNTFLMLFILSVSISQDLQWLVNNGMGKTGMNASGLNNYNNPITSNPIKINNVYPPIPTQGRKDFFIIYTDGTYYNSRPAPGSVSNLNWNNFTSNSTDFIFGNSGKIVDYLYLSNIYQGDDPPSNVSVAEENTIPSSVNNLSPTTSPTFSANHDIIKGKDITLIIPSYLFDSCRSTKLDLTLDPYSNLFTPQNIFDNGTRWSYHDLGSVSFNSNKVIGISRPPTGSHHFFNFKVDLNSTASIGTQKSFTLTCNESNKVVAQFSEKISEVHDPNYIRVMCVYSKKGRNFVKYKVQFMNDGNQNVNTTKVSFNLPAVVKPGSFKAGKWAYGSQKNKCGQQVEMNAIESSLLVNITFNPTLKPNYFLAKQQDPNLSIHTPDQYGWLEFCVEVFQDAHAYNFVNLLPSSTITDFDGLITPIIEFIDPHDADVRPYSNEFKCNCNCLYRVSEKTKK